MALQTSGIFETALYVDDLDRAIAFYTGLLNCPIVRRHERFCALRLAPEQVLLLFLRGVSLTPVELPGGMIPAHDGSGPLHVCFGIAGDEVSAWEQRLGSLSIPIESRVKWPSGALSLYFRDPDCHAVELATPGVWNE